MARGAVLLVLLVACVTCARKQRATLEVESEVTKAWTGSTTTLPPQVAPAPAAPPAPPSRGWQGPKSW